MPPLQQQQQQQPCCEEEIVGDGNFKWGNKRGTGVRNKDTQFYDSFVLDGVEYFLYDCVYFYHTNHVETSIGKLVKMYQTTTEKMVKVVWFFRPSEIRNFFGSYKPGWNELFLASGKDTGVTNRNSVDSIIGKCSVVCTSEDKRNPKPSETELKRADFVFKCTFDVDRLVIRDKFPDKIDGIEVEKFFNKKVDKKTSNNLHLETNNTSKSLKIKIKKRSSENVKDKDEVRDEVKAETAPSDILRCKDKDEMRISENVSPKINMRTSENFKDEVKTKTAPSDILRYKDEVGTSENVSPKIKMRTSESFKDEVKDEVKAKTAHSDILRYKDEVGTSENFKDEVKDEFKTKTAPSDILRYKDEVRMSENVSPKIKIRTSENFKDEVEDEVKTKTAPSDILHCKVKDKARTYENVSPKRSLDSHSFKKRKIIEENFVGQSSHIQKKEDFDEKEELRQDKSVKPNRKVIEVTERPNSEKRKWFKNMPWKDRLQKAKELDTLVLLSNLDPSYTSYEVEDLVWHAFKEKAEARMIESSPTSNTYYGRALVIFRTKEAAENAISELNRRCLILEGGRVVIARKGTVTDPAKQNTLTGHLSINRDARHKQSREMRNAVSTSHCSQPNTIEYAMAMEWTKQYYKSEACWKALCEKQMKEIDDVKSKLRSDNIF